jgi:acetate kinase
MFLLAINSGSSSIKVSVYSHGKSSKELQALQVVEVSSITSSRPKLKIESDSGDEKGKDISGIESQQDAFHQVLDHLLGDDGPNVIKSKSDISIVVHRIVHGGEYASPKLVDEDTFEVLEDLSDLAPLYVSLTARSKRNLNND